MELPLVILVTLIGGTEELVFSGLPLGEVMARLTAPLALRPFAASSPVALAEMELDAGN